jgi:hypothetical protein
MESERVRELEAKVDELTEMVRRLAVASPPEALPGALPASEDDGVVETTSRRNMLRNVALVAGGAVAASVAGSALPAAAVDPFDLTLGSVLNTTAGKTAVNFVPVSGSGGNGFLFQAGSGFETDNSGSPAAVAAWTTLPNWPNGLYAYTTQAGAATVAFGAGATSYGVRAYGGRAQVLLMPAGVAAPARTDAHTIGEMVEDGTGDLWLCVAAGTPGTWRKLAGPATAGTFHSIAPVRVYDSRLGGVPQPGRLSSPDSRIVSIKDARNENTGDVVTANVVPVGATAIVCNLTVTDSTGAGGFLSVVPGDATAASGSSINWFGTGQNIANGSTSRIAADRTVKVFAGGGSSTHFIIDVSGYYR